MTKAVLRHLRTSCLLATLAMLGANCGHREDAAPRMARRGKRRKRAALAVLVISAMLAIGVALAVLFAGGSSQGPGDRRPPPTDGALI